MRVVLHRSLNSSSRRVFGFRWSAVLRTVAAALLSLTVLACGGAEEREAAYLERGKTFYAAGDLTKARLEFKNAHQINATGVEALFYLGLIEESEQNWQEAYAAFTRVTELDTDHIGAKLHLGRFLMLAEEYDRALEMVDAAMLLDPDSAEAHALRGAVLLRRSSLAEAEIEGQRALQIDPGSQAAVAVLVGIYRKQNRFGEGQDLLDRALALTPDNETLRILKIVLFVESEETDQVETQFAELFAIDPNNREYLISLARLYISWNRLDDAEILLREAVAQAPGNEPLNLLLVDFLSNQRGLDAAVAGLTDMIAAAPENYAYRFALAKVYAQHGQTALIEPVLLEILDKDPDGPQGLAAKTTLANLRLNEGAEAEARAMIAEVLERDSANADALILRSRLLVGDGEYEEAIADLRAVLRSDPFSPRALGMLSDVHVALGQVDLASENLRALIDVDPLNDAAYLRLAQLLMQQGNVDTPIRLLDRVLERNPTLLDVLRTKGELLLTRGDLGEAARLANTLLEELPGQSFGYWLRGAVQVREGKADAAIETYRTGLAAIPEAHDLTFGMVQALVIQDKSEEAIQHLRTYINSNEGDPVAYNLLGEVYANRGEDKLADQAFQGAIETQRDWVSPYLNLGRLRIGANDPAGAAEALSDGLKSVPGSNELLFGLAAAYDTAGNFGGALDAYKKILDADETADVAANNYAALIADHRTDDPEALNLALTLAKRFQVSDNGFYLDTLGWVHYRLGNLNEAIAYLNRAVAIAPDEAQFRYHLGMAYRESGLADQAVQQLEHAVDDETKSYPGIEEARATLADLKSL